MTTTTTTCRRRLRLHRRIIRTPLRIRPLRPVPRRVAVLFVRQLLLLFLVIAPTKIPSRLRHPAAVKPTPGRPHLRIDRPMIIRALRVPRIRIRPPRRGILLVLLVRVHSRGNVISISSVSQTPSRRGRKHLLVIVARVVRRSLFRRRRDIERVRHYVYTINHQREYSKISRRPEKIPIFPLSSFKKKREGRF